MRIVSRKVTTLRNKDELVQILRNSASKYHSAEFADDVFRFTFPCAWGRKGKIMLPIKGSIAQKGDGAEVRLEVWAGLREYLVLAFISMFLLVSGFALYYIPWTFLLYPVLGIVHYLVLLFDGIMCLDALEHRLTRDQSSKE